MGTSLLLLSTATAWFGTARAPRALANAGFEVSLLMPKGSLAEKSSYVAKVGHLPDAATSRDWLYGFAAMAKATSPRLVMACDDMSFRLLVDVVLAPSDEMEAALRLRLASLVRESLGDPAYYRASVDKTLMPPAAEALGVRVPAYEVVTSVEQAAAFAAAHGYPVALKRAHGFAGAAVALCANGDELGRAFTEFAKPTALDLADSSGRMVVQVLVRGTTHYYNVAAWKGALLAGWGADKVVADPDPIGPATVVRHRREPSVRDFARRLVEGWGMTGLISLECVLEEGSGVPYLLEVTRRLNPGVHRGSWVGVDVCSALHAAVHGQPLPTRADMEEGEERIAAYFPQEWLRDPSSRYLREYPVDVPWDEPELIEAMLAMGHGR